MTTTMEVIVVLAGIGNIAWAFHNWQLRGKLTALITEAESSLKRSRQLFANAQMSSIEQEHKVCSHCERIVTKHTTDDEGKTVCVNCAKNLTQKVI